MEFYVIRFFRADGTWSHLWTIFARDIRDALDRFMIERELTDISEINVRKRPVRDAESLYGRTDIGGGAIEHPTVLWATEPPLSL